MGLANEEIILILHSLIEISRDGNQGFKDAGDDVKDKNLRSLLHVYSEQRMNFSLELQGIVEKLGGDINITGSILGALHRRWMDIRFGIIGSNTRGILKECLRGESAAISKYENALKRGLPENIKSVVEKQLGEINKTAENLRKYLESLGLLAARHR